MTIQYLKNPFQYTLDKLDYVDEKFDLEEGLEGDQLERINEVIIMMGNEVAAWAMGICDDDFLYNRATIRIYIKPR